MLSGQLNSSTNPDKTTHYLNKNKSNKICTRQIEDLGYDKFQSSKIYTK